MKTNAPNLWLADFPRPAGDGHKYDRGQAVIYGGPEKTGAARLAARACARIGAGLTTICAPAGRGDLYRMEIEPHLMVSEAPFTSLLDHPKTMAFCIGPGAGADIADMVIKALTTGKPCVLDADALTVFTGDLKAYLFDALHDYAVLTPHGGEYARLFGDLPIADAARQAGCTVVKKGAETQIAAPNGQLVLNHADAPYLASAGTGDVLAGMITGLLAQGMGPFQAACAAVWIHGEIGKVLGAGLVASDLPDQVPLILKQLDL